MDVLGDGRFRKRHVLAYLFHPAKSNSNQARNSATSPGTARWRSKVSRDDKRQVVVNDHGSVAQTIAVAAKGVVARARLGGERDLPRKQPSVENWRATHQRAASQRRQRGRGVHRIVLRHVPIQRAASLLNAGRQNAELFVSDRRFNQAEFAGLDL